MTQLILKNDIQPHQLSGLLQLLRSRGIEAEVLPAATRTEVKKPVATDTATDTDKPYVAFSESFGMWKDRDIDARELRRQASGYDRRTKNYDTL
jgi:hypothetical protein